MILLQVVLTATYAIYLTCCYCLLYVVVVVVVVVFDIYYFQLVISNSRILHWWMIPEFRIFWIEVRCGIIMRTCHKKKKG